MACTDCATADADRQAREILARYVRRVRGAQGMFDEILLPKDVLAQLESANVDFERVNLVAKDRADWQLLYNEWKRYYAETKDRWGISLNQSTIEEIRRRHQRLAEFQKQLATSGVSTGAPVVPGAAAPLFEPISDKTADRLGSVAKYGLAAAALYLTYEFVSKRGSK